MLHLHIFAVFGSSVGTEDVVGLLYSEYIFVFFAACIVLFLLRRVFGGLYTAAWAARILALLVCMAPSWLQFCNLCIRWSFLSLRLLLFVRVSAGLFLPVVAAGEIVGLGLSFYAPLLHFSY